MAHNKLWKNLKEMGILDHLNWLLRNLYAGQETTENETWNNRLVPNWERLFLSPCLFNLYAYYAKCWAGWSTSWNQDCQEKYHNLRYTDDTTLISESKELKSLLMKVKEESEKVGLNSTFRKLRSWHLAPSFHGKYMGKQRNSDKLYLLGLQNHCR